MAYLLDTSILARLANSADAIHALAQQAVMKLHRHGETLHTTAQTLIEFRNVATRPAASNGLGLPCSTVESLSATFESLFPLLAETPDIFPAWKTIVQSHAVVAKQVHDARLFAICQVHGISHLMTFNVSHFARFAGVTQGTVVVAPQSV